MGMGAWWGGWVIKHEIFMSHSLLQFDLKNLTDSISPSHRGGSNEYPQSMFLSKNKKNNVYPCKPQFYYIKWGLRGQNYIGFVMHVSSRQHFKIYFLFLFENRFRHFMQTQFP